MLVNDWLIWLVQWRRWPQLMSTERHKYICNAIRKNLTMLRSSFCYPHHSRVHLSGRIPKFRLLEYTENMYEGKHVLYASSPLIVLSSAAIQFIQIISYFAHILAVHTYIYLFAHFAEMIWGYERDNT